MSFTEDQIKLLEKPLSPDHVTQREQAGRKLDYIEAWHAIAEANRIFGFDGWDRQTELVQLGEPRVKDDKWRVDYRARVTITVRGKHGGIDIVRQGCGFGQGIDRDVGQAHESALKEAESDAMKRALMTFGNPFGLALYDKSKASVGYEIDKARLTELEEGMIAATDLDTLKQLVTEEYANDLGQLFSDDKAEWQRLSGLFRRRTQELTKPKEIEVTLEKEKEKAK